MPPKTTNDIREAYQLFFAERGHVRIPSAPLVPEGDATTLFTGSGMQPLLPYLLGAPHPQGKRLVNSQKSFRAEDIEEVGDNRHTTFFEMLGNWSLGDYFKAEQLPWLFEFLTKVVALDPKRLYVSVFAGDSERGLTRDIESAEIWQNIFTSAGVEAKTVELMSVAEGGAQGMQGGRIFYYDSTKNWWSRSGRPENMPAGEPGGPDSEVFFDFGTPHDQKFGAHCHPNCDCGRFMEIGNSVFMEYVKQGDGSFAPLPKRNVDFGGGLERIMAAAQNTPDVFQIDVFAKLIAVLEAQSQGRYGEAADRVSLRIIADHIRAATFIIADGVTPSTTDQGYVVRRLIRRAARHAQKISGQDVVLGNLVSAIAEEYREAYPAVLARAADIRHIIGEEVAKFNLTLRKGLLKVEQILQNRDDINAQQAFELYATYGFPLDLTIELAREKSGTVDEVGFHEEMEKHRALSREGSQQKFKGGLADTSEMSVKYHTATHLLHQALQDVLGNHAVQKGSNITAERLRFDFSHPEKLTAEELRKVTEIVNEKIKADLPVRREETTVDEARARGAQGLFAEKYGERVNVYTIGDYSIEICGGPHVERTGVLGIFSIQKEESAGAGVRRIKAVLQ